MVVGVPKEIKTREGRVALTPTGARALVEHGHGVLVERGAGVGSGIADAAYMQAGAILVEDPAEVWGSSAMIVKVKEPVEDEYPHLRQGLIIFTYLHLAASERLTRTLLKSGVIGIAYETMRLADGSLPLLAPMSAVAGRLAVQAGCACLEARHGGKGVLVSGVPGVAPARVTILGAGSAGMNACHLAVGLGARVTIIDIDQRRLNYIEDLFHSRAVTLMSDAETLEESVAVSDLVIGSVLIPGKRTPQLVSREMLRTMEPGSAFVDIAIDQGGCAQTSRPTTHDEPTYIEEGIVHYCVANMPGAVPRTSTRALTNLSLPYVLELADRGYEGAFKHNRTLLAGLNVCQGRLTSREVAESFGWEYVPYAA